MDTDKILIVIAIMIASTAFVFKNQIMEDIELVRKFQKKNLVEEFSMSYLYPLSQQERIAALEEHIEKMATIRKRGLFVNYFVDFDAYVMERENELLGRRESISQGEDFISFSTLNLNHISASLNFPKEQLLNLASLIDQVFPENAGTASYELDWKGCDPLLTMSLFEGFPSVEKQRYREFVNRISKDVFDNKPVSLHVYLSDSVKKRVFKSRPLKLPLQETK